MTGKFELKSIGILLNELPDYVPHADLVNQDQTEWVKLIKSPNIPNMFVFNYDTNKLQYICLSGWDKLQELKKAMGTNPEHKTINCPIMVYENLSDQEITNIIKMTGPVKPHRGRPKTKLLNESSDEYLTNCIRCGRVFKTEAELQAHKQSGRC